MSSVFRDKERSVLPYVVKPFTVQEGDLWQKIREKRKHRMGAVSQILSDHTDNEIFSDLKSGRGRFDA